MSKLIPLIIILCSLLITSCLSGGGSSDSSSKYFTVQKSDPEDGSTDFDIYDVIEVDFSRLLDEDVTEYTNENGEVVSVITVTNTTTNQLVEGVFELDLWTYTFTPSSPLQWNTTYEIFVSKNIRSFYDNTMVEDQIITFTTVEAPVAEFVGLSHTGTEANAIKPLTINFNFEPDSTINYSNVISVYNSTRNQQVSGRVQVNVGSQSMTFTPDQGYFDYNSSFTVSLNGSIGGVNGREYLVLDQATFGSRNFSTPGPMLTSYTPSSTNTHPSPNSFSLKKQVKINLGFNFTVANISPSNIILREQSTGNQIPVDLTTSLPAADVTLATRGPLKYDTTYEVSLNNNFNSSLSSNIKLPENFSWTFKTQKKKVSSQSVFSFSSSFELDEEIRITTNFDMSSSSYLTVRGQDHDDFTLRLDGDLKYTNDPFGGSFIREIVVSKNDVSRFRFDQDLQVEFAVFDIETGNEIESDNFSLDVDELKVTPINKSPSNNSSSVAPNVDITFEYSIPEKIDNDYALLISLNPSSFLRVEDCFDETVTGYLEVSLTSSKFTFTPDYILDSGCTYTVEILPGVRLTDSNIVTESASWSFTTEIFEVESVVATPSTGRVDIDSDFNIRFSDTIVEYDDLGVFIETADGFSEVPVSVFKFSDTLTVTPIYNLEYSTSYTLVVEYNAVSSYDGVSLKFDFEYDFTTEDEAVPLVPFDITSVDAYTYNELVDIDSDFAVQFTDEIGSYDSVGIFLENESTFFDESISVAVIYDQLIITPIYLLDYDTDYTLVIRSYAVEGIFENELGYDYEYSFTTEEEDTFASAPAGLRTVRSVRGNQSSEVLRKNSSRKNLPAKVVTPLSKLEGKIRSNKRSSKKIKNRLKFQKKKKRTIER